MFASKTNGAYLFNKIGMNKLVKILCFVLWYLAVVDISGFCSLIIVIGVPIKIINIISF